MNLHAFVALLANASTTTGIFTGTFVLNLCPKYTSTYSVTKFGSTTSSTFSGSTASCNTLTLPYYAQSLMPMKAGNRQAVAYTVQGGQVYGPMDAG